MKNMFDISLKEQLILDLYTVGAIKFGKFKLKSGITSPYYLDLRMLVSYPHLLQLTADVFWEKLRVIYFDVIAGVPYTAIPIATAVGVNHMQTMIFVRKEVKDYGTKKRIEGQYHEGQKVVIVDDVITNGESKIETIQHVEEAGLTVEQIVVLVDRGQGGPELLKKMGYNCQAIYSMDQIFHILLDHKRVPKKTIQECIKYNKESKKKFLRLEKKAAKSRVPKT